VISATARIIALLQPTGESELFDMSQFAIDSSTTQTIGSVAPSIRKRCKSAETSLLVTNRVEIIFVQI
jgi:hypothetical protein